MILGLTGGIGSGKSTVAKLFEILGYAIFSSDQVAKEVYFDEAVRKKVEDLLGVESYLSKTQLNKSYINSRIFSDTLILHQLNAIIHPAVKEQMALFVMENPGKSIIKESALLFETGLNKEVEKTIVVVADKEQSIARVMQRDGLSREDVIKKINSQMPPEEKQKRADFVINNNEQELLIEQVLHIHQTLNK